MASKFYDNLKHTIRFWLLRTLPTCQQTVKIISESMERPLTLSERLKLKLHLWICAWCLWYFEHLHLIRDAARAKAQESPDLGGGPVLTNEARERIRRSLTGGN